MGCTFQVDLGLLGSVYICIQFDLSVQFVIFNKIGIRK